MAPLICRACCAAGGICSPVPATGNTHQQVHVKVHAGVKLLKNVGHLTAMDQQMFNIHLGTIFITFLGLQPQTTKTTTVCRNFKVPGSKSIQSSSWKRSLTSLCQQVKVEPSHPLQGEPSAVAVLWFRGRRQCGPTRRCRGKMKRWRDQFGRSHDPLSWVDPLTRSHSTAPELS